MSGLYISWPFCSQKCTYCNFASGVFPGGFDAQYLKALQEDLSALDSSFTVDTLYLGGGTPGSLSPELLQALLSAIPGSPWREATLEAAPGDLPPETLRAWRTAGINRVSFGAQSFIRTELSRTGRKHDAATIIRNVADLRLAGIDDINIDLIAGLPGQTPASWRESLDSLIALNVPHASVYMLEVDGDSRLGAEILAGGSRYGAKDVPSPELIADFYETAVAVLEDAGLRRYEISNFATSGKESRHNLKYWRLEPYVGLGADAHSFDGSHRWRKAESAVDYVRDPLARFEVTSARPDEEKFFVGLRLTEGVEINEADEYRFGHKIAQFTRDGLIERHSRRIRLTPRGVMLSNEVFEEFIGA